MPEGVSAPTWSRITRRVVVDTREPPLLGVGAGAGSAPRRPYQREGSTPERGCSGAAPCRRAAPSRRSRLGAMQIRELTIAGAFEVTPRQFPDDRGAFWEWYRFDA